MVGGRGLHASATDEVTRLEKEFVLTDAAHDTMGSMAGESS
jgi:hypothetical protein